MNKRLETLPKVSIGLPVYNGEEYLRKTLDCLLGQTFLDIEIIVSDDNSSDQTKDICLEYCKQDNRVRYLKQEKNFGMPVKNFRFVLDNAVGEYFMFASHDDSWDDRYIEELVSVLDNDSNCSLVFSNYKIKNLKGAGEILIDVSSSVSESKYIRYMTRLIDSQPALIFGLFRREIINSKDIILADMFTLHFGNLMSLKGKIKVVDKYIMSWGINGSRDSYSMTGKIISYRQYYISQIKLILQNFNFLKWPLPIIFISVWLINGWIKRRVFPHKFNINFNK
ncbi:MAG: glycosyltransferase [Proteobacteria bacterium]|nr:glycosyltransferase [Pseudomonadota bacterium]MCH9749784.1 glycosyltransferase [Pseudomonadota bacterium]